MEECREDGSAIFQGAASLLVVLRLVLAGPGQVTPGWRRRRRTTSVATSRWRRRLHRCWCWHCCWHCWLSLGLPNLPNVTLGSQKRCVEPLIVRLQLCDPVIPLRSFPLQLCGLCFAGTDCGLVLFQLRVQPFYLPRVVHKGFFNTAVLHFHAPLVLVQSLNHDNFLLELFIDVCACFLQQLGLFNGGGFFPFGLVKVSWPPTPSPGRPTLTWLGFRRPGTRSQVSGARMTCIRSGHLLLLRGAAGIALLGLRWEMRWGRDNEIAALGAIRAPARGSGARPFFLSMASLAGPAAACRCWGCHGRK